MRFNPTIMDNQVPHRDPRQHAAPMQPEEKGESDCSLPQVLYGGLDWECGAPGERLHLGTIRLHLGNQRESEKDTNTTARNTPPHKTKQVFGHSYQKHSDYWT